MNKAELINRIYKGVEGFARKQSINPQQAEDFMQTAFCKVLEVVDKYVDKPDNEIEKLAGTIAKNAIFSFQKSEVTYGYNNSMDVEKGFFPSEDKRIRDSIENQNVVKILRTLSEVERKILEEFMDPSDRLLGIVEQERKEKLIERSQGKLKMNIHNNKIQSKHVAALFGISKATMSRHMSSIRREVDDRISFQLEG